MKKTFFLLLFFSSLVYSQELIYKQNLLLLKKFDNSMLSKTDSLNFNLLGINLKFTKINNTEFQDFYFIKGYDQPNIVFMEGFACFRNEKLYIFNKNQIQLKKIGEEIITLTIFDTIRKDALIFKILNEKIIFFSSTTKTIKNDWRLVNYLSNKLVNDSKYTNINQVLIFIETWNKFTSYAYINFINLYEHINGFYISEEELRLLIWSY